jgi:hypothetical protein
MFTTLSIDITMKVILEYLNGGALADLVALVRMTEPQIAAVCKEVIGNLT